MNRPRFSINFGPVSRPARLIIGVLFVVGTCLCGLVALIASHHAADRVEHLQPISARDLVSTPPGVEVLIEAHVADDNRVLLEPYRFVAYVREGRSVWEDDGSWETGSWSERERVTPPLLLDLGDVVIEIENDDYELRNVRTVETGGRAGEPDDTRYSGLRAGEPVLVLGTVLGGKEVGRVEAEFIAGGTRDSYIAGQRSAGWIFAFISLVVALLGSAFLLREPLSSFWSLWKRRQQSH
ncbi:MAG: hypothetical protein JXA93_24005 [Anaerolineae bacterium]|nr:hypothetical protein [Anaerolineae bacterium]